MQIPSCAKELAYCGGPMICESTWPFWPSIPDEESLMGRIGEVIRSGRWTVRCAGRKDSELGEIERIWAQRCQVEFALGVTSGSAALELALRALRIGPGDEVIVPSIGWYATAAAVCRVGAIPVFADIDMRTSCMDAKYVRDLVTDHTKAIIVVHLHCAIADMEQFEYLSISTGIPLIEDAAQAAGGSYRGRAVGSFGAMGCFSFNQEKQLPIGEGGAIVTNDAGHYEALFALRTDGYLPLAYSKLDWIPSWKYLGGNAVMSEFSAAIWRTQLHDFDRCSVIRNQHGSRLAGKIADSGIGVPLETSPGTDMRPWYEFGFIITHEALAKWPIRLQAEVLSAEIGIEVHPTDAPVQSCGQLGRTNGNDTPSAVNLSQRLLVFHHRYLLDEQVIEVVPAALRKMAQIADSASVADVTVARKCGASNERR